MFQVKALIMYVLWKEYYSSLIFYANQVAVYIKKENQFCGAKCGVGFNSSRRRRLCPSIPVLRVTYFDGAGWKDSLLFKRRREL